MERETVRVAVPGGESYDVVIDGDLAHEVRGAVPEAAVRVAIIHTSSVTSIAARVRDAMTTSGRTTVVIQVPEGEQAKTVACAESCWRVLGEAGFTRSDVVVGVGGGATTDLAGFVAGTWLRGIAVVQVPTTLLAMVDASIGGKTGINTEMGKNLVGVFHSPIAVIVNPSVLGALPPDQYASGLAEVAKAGFVGDPTILDLLGEDPISACDPSATVAGDLIRRAIRVKARVVSGDFRETGDVCGGIGREMLNYGHTLGHAIEKGEHFAVPHGHAVSIGMIFAAELAALSGHLSPAEVDLHRDVLSTIGLPITYRQDRWEVLLSAMAIDKKTRAHTLRFVILDGIGAPAILADPDEGLLERAYRRIG